MRFDNLDLQRIVSQVFAGEQKSREQEADA
jgi:hypothetical protein